jgi:hypothetical protein
MNKSSLYSTFLGKKDSFVNYQSKWMIYKLNVFDKNGLWIKFKDKLNDLNSKNNLKIPEGFELFDYYMENPDIEFELLFFNDIMQKHHIFKINDIIYSYSIGKKTKKTKNIAYVRFYFDLNELFNY